MKSSVSSNSMTSQSLTSKSSYKLGLGINKITEVDEDNRLDTDVSPLAQKETSQLQMENEKRKIFNVIGRSSS